MPSPIRGQLPSTPYKKLGSRWSKGYHTGVDYAVPVGTDVLAIADGTIVNANWGRSYGEQLVCAIDGGWIIYAHLSAALVKPGNIIKAGQVIAKSGNTGHSTGPHLHVELRNHQKWSLGIDMDLSPLIGIAPAKVVTKVKAKIVAPVIKKKAK
jgi:murein DD-endopeptidase MepM/ murein hydrolase activator NlpD